MQLHPAEVTKAVRRWLNPIVTLSAASSLGHSDSGKVFVLSAATEFVTTLPTPKKGWRAKFIVGAAPAGASYRIVTSSSANVIQGQVCSAEDAAGSVVTAADADTITFADGLAIVGDYVEMISDGTNFYISGMCNVQDGIATSQAS
jgi:hypothetical protein